MDIQEVRDTVADMLVEVGHGNLLFIDDIRTGNQDDGPFMRAALAVNDRWLSQLLPAPEMEHGE